MTAPRRLVARPRTAPPPATGNAWRAQAACAGLLDLFYGPDGEHPRTKTHREQKARAVCAGCPVTTECLTDALHAEASIQADHRHGIRAGTTPEQRWAPTDRRRA